MWRADHHRNLFGTDKKTPFIKSKENEWQTSARVNYSEKAGAHDMPSAGASTFVKPEDYKMQFMTTT